MTKDQTLFFLNRAMAEIDVPSHEEMARQGMSYEARAELLKSKAAQYNQLLALEHAKDLVNAMTDKGFEERFGKEPMNGDILS